MEVSGCMQRKPCLVLELIIYKSALKTTHSSHYTKNYVYICTAVQVQVYVYNFDPKTGPQKKQS